MDSQDRFEQQVRFVFTYFDQKEEGSVPVSCLPHMLRSLGQVWSFSELLDLCEKHSESNINLRHFQDIARAKRKQEIQALSGRKRGTGSVPRPLPVEPAVEGLSAAEMQELRICFSLLDPENTQLCSVSDLSQVVTCLGERLSHGDVQQLLSLEKLEDKQFLTFSDLARLCARI